MLGADCVVWGTERDAVCAVCGVVRACGCVSVDVVGCISVVRLGEGSEERCEA